MHLIQRLINKKYQKNMKACYHNLMKKSQKKTHLNKIKKMIVHNKCLIVIIIIITIIIIIIHYNSY